MGDELAVRNTAITSDERIRNALKRHIRRAYDTREFTRETLARESKVSVCQIDQIMSGDAAKHRRVAAEDALCLAYALGDDAVNAIMATISFGARRLGSPDELQVHAIVANGLQHFSTIATAAADGRIDHVERPLCRDAADQIIATVMPLSSAGEAA